MEGTEFKSESILFNFYMNFPCWPKAAR